MDRNRLYLEMLEEFIYDDMKFISYKHLSCKLKVHVNLAKQMLYAFLEQQKSKGKEIHAIYFISGVAPQKWIYSSDGDEDDDYYKGDGMLVMLCKDNELEEMKKRFTIIYSVHVYGLSAFPMTKRKLNDVANTKIVDDDDRGPVHYGPIICPTAFEYRPHPRLAEAIQRIQEVRIKVREDKEKFEKEQALKKELNASKKTEPVVTPQKNKKNAAAGNQKDRLKNMFAAAANKPPKFEKVKVVEDKQSKATSSHQLGEENQSRKRKRIQDVFSDSEDDKNHSEKRGSDSDDYDAFKSTTKNFWNSGNVKPSNDQRRDQKNLPMHHIDTEGFRAGSVTEHLLVSDDNLEVKKVPAAKRNKPSEQPKPNKLERKNSKIKTVNSNSKKTSKKGSKLVLPANTAEKAKQSSIMAFFKKL